MLLLQCYSLRVLLLPHYECYDELNTYRFTSYLPYRGKGEVVLPEEVVVVVPDLEHGRDNLLQDGE